MVRSSWVALSFIAVRQAHGDGSQSPYGAHDVGRLNFVRGQVSLDASNDISARFDIQNVNF